MRGLTVLLIATFALIVSYASFKAVVDIGARSLTCEAAYDNAMTKLNKRSHRHKGVN